MEEDSNAAQNEAGRTTPPEEDPENQTEELWNQSPLTRTDENVPLDDATVVYLDSGDSATPDESVRVTISSSEQDISEIPPVVVAPPPIFYQGVFRRYFPDPPEGSSDEEYESEEEAELLVESRSLRDTNTLFGNVMVKTNVTETQAFLFEGNTDQAKNATKILDAMTTKPFNSCWNYFTEGYPIVLYFANLIVAIYDLSTGPVNLHFKIPGFIFGIVENIILWTVLLVFYFKKNKEERHEKYQQYVENIVHELLIYPTIILSVVGFANDQLWAPQSALEYTSLVLLVLDTIDLIKTMGNRMFILYSLMKDIQRKVLRKEEVTCADFKFAGGILPRTFFTIAGNTLLFLMLIFLFGAQVAKDNPVKEQGYSLSVQSGVLLVAMVVLPPLSTIIFLVANSFWLLEIFVTINLNAVDMPTEMAKGSYDVSLLDALGFATKKASETRERWTDIQKLSKWQKIFYGITEVHTIALFFLWEALVVACVYCFQGYADHVTLWSLRSSCLLLGTAVNFHVVVLSLTANILTPLVIAGLASYPLFILMCFKKKHKVHQEGTDADDSDDDD